MSAAAHDVLPPALTDQRGEQLDEIRMRLDRLAGQNRYYGDVYYRREGATKLDRFLDSGIVAWSIFLAACATVGGLIAVDPSGTKPFSATAVPSVAVLAAGAVALFGLWRLQTRVVSPKRLRFTSAGHTLLDAFMDARTELGKAVASGHVAAQRALDAVNVIVPGYEDLLIEYTRYSSELSSTEDRLARTRYADALSAVVGDLYDELLDITVEVTAAARVAFSSRTDLLVPVETDTTTVDLEALRARTDEVKARMAKARAELSSYVQAANA